MGSLRHLTDGDAPLARLAVLPDGLDDLEARTGRPVLVHGPNRTNGNLMALIACPKCNSEDINGTPQADSRLLIHCNDCGHEWLRGEARRDPGRPAVQTIDSLHAAFPTAADVRPDVRERVALLKSEFLLNRPEPDPEVADYRDALPGAVQPRGPVDGRPPTTCSTSRTPTTVASPGNMSGFNRAWKTQGPDKAAQKVRESIEYLLYGPESLRLEDRLTQLIDGKKGLGFPSFNKEPLLTKVLCVVEPDRFLPVLKYSARDRRQEGDRQAGLRPRPAAGREGGLDDRAPGRLEQRPAALAGRQRHPRPAAGHAVPGVGEDPAGAVPHLTARSAGDGRHPAGGELRVDRLQRGQRRHVLLVLQPAAPRRARASQCPDGAACRSFVRASASSAVTPTGCTGGAGTAPHRRPRPPCRAM